MNILHVHSGNLYGGVETFLTTLARARRAAPAMQMSVALSFDGKVGEELRAEGVSTPLLGEVRLRRPDSVWRGRRRLAALLAREKFDVAVCHQAWPQLVFGPVIRRARVPLVLWVHMIQNTHHWLERMAWRTRPDCIIANSCFTASTLPPTNTRVETIYYPVMASGRGATRPRSVVRSELNTAPTDVVIIQVSRMEAMKGQAILLDALGALRARPDWTLWVVGGAQREREARYLESLRVSAVRLGISDRVRFLGHRNDVSSLVSAADLFCQPNLAPEGFGISFVEAMSAGLPVVTSAIGGALEIVDEWCGALLPPGDTGALATVLDRLLEDGAGRARLGQKGRIRAAQLCDPATQTQRIATLMETIS
jgi:glycosyltransferase involved in cell wall biosynthesis